MKNINKNIEDLTFKSIKSLGPDEPSMDFTYKVMQSIFESEATHSKVKKNYLWIIGIVPLLVIAGWVIINFVQISGYVTQLIIFTKYSINAFFNTFSPLAHLVKNLNIQPIFLITFIGILLLLVIEEIVNKWKFLSKT